MQGFDELYQVPAISGTDLWHKYKKGGERRK